MPSGLLSAAAILWLVLVDRLLKRDYPLFMGIWDRDYMKQSSKEDGVQGDASSSASSASKAEDLARRFFEKYPRFFLYLGVGIGVMIVIALVVGRFSGDGR